MNDQQKATILIVDDDASHRMMLRTLIEGWGYATVEADDGSVAIERVEKGPFDLILMDVRMVKVSGLEALGAIQTINPAIPVLIMTAYSSIESAVSALKSGAYDYLTKPLDFDKLKITIERAMEHLRLKGENRRLKQQLGRHLDNGKIIGRSPAIIRLLETVAQVAPTEATVLLSGDSGTGKELFAEAIHRNSHRSQAPFIKINCAAITETLLESEMFGHEKGAFTGATRRKEGCFVQAHGGTLFLDEIGEMPISMQVKLLRVLQEGEVRRVGGEETLKVDVRVIAATNRDLKALVADGLFREDLFYRLNVVGLEILPLCARKEDLPLLAQHFLKKLAEKNKKPVAGFTPAAMDHLMRHEWPGNVRELMNAVERAVVMARSEYIDQPDLLFVPADRPGDSLPQSIDSAEPNAPVSLEQVERKAILQTLEDAQGNKSEAARRLGITRRTLHKKLKKYGVMP